MAIPAADTDLRIVIRAIQETITDTKIPGTQAETHPLSELLTISDTVVFNTFCCELCSSIRDCLHHPRIKAQSARERAYRCFNQARLMELPRTWKRLFSRISVIGQQFDHPLHLQAVNRRLFNQLLTNKLLCETSATNSTSLCDAALTLSNEEENAIRYACGYVCMKVLKTLRSSKKANAIQFAECLSNMACDGDESSYYKYTLHWTGIVNRGGLFVVGEYPFLLFKALEVQTKLFLPAYLGKSLQSADIKQLVDRIFADKDVKYYWSMVAVDIESEEDSQELLQMLLEKWITLRGHAITSAWLEEYRRVQTTTKRSLRSSLVLNS